MIYCFYNILYCSYNIFIYPVSAARCNLCDRMGKKGKKEMETSKETFDPLPVETKAPATVVLLLNSQEEDVLVKACEAIYTFAEKGNENKVSLFEVGALEPLCKIISHSNNLVRRNAIMALGSMSTNEDVVVHEFSTLCLASLSVDYVSMAQIFESNGLPPVIQLLSSSDPDVQKNSLEIIFNLVQDYKSRQAVHEFGGMVPLLELLKSDFPVIQQLVLKVLQNLTMDLETRNTFRQEQGFEKLLEILSNQDFSDLHSDVLLIVANCLCNSETIHSLAEDGGLAKVMDFILLPSVPEIHSNAIKCISRSAQSSKCCKVLHEHGVEKVLVELLSVENVDVNISTCHAVAAMSLHQASKDTFRDLGGVAKLVESMSSESLHLKEAASAALSNLTHDKNNSMTVFEVGGHTLLIKQLSCSCPKTVANSASTLCNMAEQVKIRRGIWSHGVMEALVEPLKSTDSQILLNSLQCLALLACDSEARVEFQSAGGLPPLVDLLRSHHKDVLARACLAVVGIAIDEFPAVEMYKLGALELLEEINLSVNRRNKFSKLATTALLKSNLSVKYSLTGHLASTDIITHGFYDAGKARQGEKVPTLDELLTQPVNQQRPVVVVYMSAEQTKAIKEEEDEEKASTKEEHKKSRKKKKKEKEENEPVNVVEDVHLQKLIKDAKECILPLNDKEQYVTLARLVSDTMGGAVDQEKLHEFPWLLHLSELKSHLQSNVVPIDLIKKAIYGERALLFKCLADQIGLSCTLVRAEYNRAFNEITLFDSPDSPLPRRYIVDLIHQPGTLLALNTPLALQYQSI
ncbi:armadillo repeat-containing protein 3 isoform X2 [Gouania willdenowi]|nr:armadillo repeat-containing protein 3 isoform X2 [Gouania willdenowi]